MGSSAHSKAWLCVCAGWKAARVLKPTPRQACVCAYWKQPCGVCWAVLLRLTLGSRTSICAAQVAQEAPAHFACGCLLLTSELLKVGSRSRERSLLLLSSGQVCCHKLESVCWRYRPRLAGPGGWALAISQPVCVYMFTTARVHSICALPHPAALLASSHFVPDSCPAVCSSLWQARPALWGAVLQPEESEADGLERFQDAPEDGPAAAAGLQLEGGSSARRAARRAAAAAAAKGGSSDGEGGSEEDEGSDAEEENGQLKPLAGSSSSEEEDEEDGWDGEADLMPGLRQQQAAAAAAAAQRAATQAAAAADAQRWPASKEAYDLHKR